MSATATHARISTFLRLAGLESLVGREADVERAVRDLVEAMGEKFAIRDPASLYTYRVPMLSEDGACSVVDEMAPVPYDLAPILGGRSDQTTRRLALLERSSSGPGKPRARTGSACTSGAAMRPACRDS